MADHASLKVDIKKAFDDFSLDVSFELKRGITALMGPSGSGKTTLANLIAGIDKPSAGSIETNTHIFFDEKNNLNLPPEKRRVGYVFQDGLLFPHLTVKQNLNYGMDKNVSHNSFTKLVRLFDIIPLLDRYPETLSGGEKRRVALGRTLLSKPDILILDEPLTGLDPARRKALFPFLDQLKQSFKGPILYISHYIDEVAHLADYGLLLEEGSLKSEGPIHQLFLEKNFGTFVGEGEGSALLDGVIESIDDDLATINCGGVPLLTTDISQKLSTKVRVNIFARDVALSLFKPEAVSVLNCIACKIHKIDDNNKRDITVHLMPNDSENESLIVSKITRFSYEHLKIKKGQTIFALIKAIAITNS